MVTQRDLIAMHNEEFVEINYQRFRDALRDLLLTNNYWIESVDENCDKLLIDQDLANEIQNLIDAFNEIYRMYKDGLNLTDTRKTKMMGAIYGIEKLVDKDTPLFQLLEELKSAREKSKELMSQEVVKPFLALFSKKIKKEYYIAVSDLCNEQNKAEDNIKYIVTKIKKQATKLLSEL